MSVQGFNNWNEGLYIDLNTELWPFIYRMEVSRSVYRGMMVEMINGTPRGTPRYEVESFSVNGKDELDFSYCHIVEYEGALQVYSYEIFGEVDGDYDYSFQFNLKCLYTKGGVLLKEMEDMKDFLLL